MFGWLALMIMIFYFILIRPQQRREKERQALLKAVKSGDRVLFAGGMIGVVTNVSDKTFSIKIADKVKVDVVRGAVTQVLDKGAELPDDVPQR
jgi:preprotein translocase subunit YajC